MMPFSVVWFKNYSVQPLMAILSLQHEPQNLHILVVGQSVLWTNVNSCQIQTSLCCTVGLWWLAHIWNIPIYFKWFICNNGLFLKLNFKSTLTFQSQDPTVLSPSSILYVPHNWIFNLCNSLILWLRSPDSVLSNSGHYIPIYFIDFVNITLSFQSEQVFFYFCSL